MVRRLLLVFLLVMLPIQFSWAVHNAYCEHDTGTPIEQTADHESDQAGAADDTDATKTSADTDNCQHSQLTALIRLQTDLTAPRVEDFRHWGHVARYRSHIPAGPERPDRAFAV